MAIKENMMNDIAVFHVSGKLMGGKETREVHEKVKASLNNSLKKIIIDLSNVKWLNSQGLGMLISCLTSVTNADAVLKISGATDHVKSLLMMTKLITIFKTYETVEQAVNSFKS